VKRRFDWSIIGAVICLVAIGIAAVYSGTYNWTRPLWKKQVVWTVVGLSGMFAASSFDYRILKRYSLFVYITAILLLIVVLFMPPVRCAHSWFTLGGISLQPSEFAKLATIIMLAEHLSYKQKSFFTLIVISLAPIALILCQPDVGTSLIFFPILLVMLYIAKTNRLLLIFLFSFAILCGTSVLILSFVKFKYGIDTKEILGGSLAIGIGFLLSFYIIDYLIKKRLHFFGLIISVSLFSAAIVSALLKEYQQKRLVVFLDPSVDPLGAGYNIIQSKIAIGAGSLTGKGFLCGTQSHLGFLPERATDFIFSVIAEEFGLLGVSTLLLLYALLVFRCLKSAYLAKDSFGKLMGVGISTMIGLSVFINIGLCLGLLPATGLPLPFVSYGGSSLLMNMISVGIILSIKRYASHNYDYRG
jgi:rod shape determining protein RodA